VGLSSDQASATVPSGVTVTQGATTATFTVSTVAVGTVTTATITGTAGSVVKTAPLTINPPALSSFTVSPGSVAGGTGATGTIGLTGRAASGGVSVSLSSNDASAVVPASVTVAAGSSSATFAIATTNVDSTRSVTVTATLDAVNLTALLSVTPCTVPPVASPASFPTADLVWMDDDLPPDSVATGPWVWDTTQKASGTRSHTEPASPGTHQHYFETDADNSFYLSASDKFVVYVLISPCDPPREIMLQWNSGGWEHRAFWGEDLIGWGETGTQSRLHVGAIPGAGQWVRLEVPAAAVGLDGRSISGIAFTLYDGQVWFDRAGKIPTCTTPVAIAPTLFPDTVWIDDTLPAGGNGHFLVWDTSQKASGTQSQTHIPQYGAQHHYFDGVTPAAMLQVGASDKLVVYALVDPCDPPQEIFIRWNDGSWEHGAFWGADLIDLNTPGTQGRVNMGALPTAGQWTRLEVPSAALDLSGSLVGAMEFLTFSGRAWFDRMGKVNATGTAALASISLSTSTAISGAAVTGTVTLTGNAPAGGTIISLVSDNVSAATVPAVVTVPPGASSGTFLVATLGVGGSQSANILATDGSSTFSAPLVVNGATLASLSVSPSSVVAATPVTGTVSLNGLAEPGGHVVSLSSDNAAAQVPAGGYVVIPAGTSSASFSITTSQVSSNTNVTITASADSIMQAAAFTIAPCSFGTAPPPSSFPPDTVWFDDAPPAGADFNGTWIWDPAQKASGTQSHTEPPAVGFTQHVLGTSGSSSLRLNPGDRLVVYALVDPCFPPREVMLQWKSGGSWEHRAFWGEDLLGWGEAGTPSRFYVGAIPPAGQWARFEIPAASVGLDGQTIDGIAFSLYDGRVWFDHVGKINLGHTPVLSTVSVNPGSVVGGTPATGTVTLTGAALTGGLVVTLSSDTTSVASFPATVTVAASSSSATFDITTLPVTGTTPVTVTATDGSETRTAVITVTPPGVASLVISPSSIVGGGASVGTVTLAAAAPAGGTSVSLSSQNTAVVTVPASVSVAEGTTSATFAVSSVPVATVQGVAITATYGGSAQSFTVTVNPPDLASVSLSPPSVTGGSPSTGTVSLTGPAPAGGLAVALSSSIGSATVPASVTVAAGATSATFTVTTSSVGSVTNGTITATLGSTIRTASLTLSPPTAALSALSLSPASVNAGSSSTGTVALTMPAPAGGFVVNLSSDNAAATVPASVTVAQGTTMATFTITTTMVGTTQTPTVSATAGGVTVTAVLTVNPPLALYALSLNPTSIAGGSPSSGTVTLTTAALAGGFVVYLSSDTGVAQTPVSVTVPQGQTAATFSVATRPVSTAVAATISASASGITKTAVLSISPPGTGTLAGTVLYAGGGSVMSGVTVTVNETGATTTTSAIGSYSFVLAAGTYTVTASLSSYQPVTSSAQVVAPNQRTTVSPLSMVAQTGTLTGTVVNGAAPVSGASVTAISGTASVFQGKATTAADGTFSMTLPSAYYTLGISKPGFADTIASNYGVGFRVTIGQTTNVGTISLSAGGTITGFVRNAVTSAGIKGASVSWGGNQALTTTDATGRFVMNVPPGTSGFSVRAAGFVDSLSSASFTVTVGQTTTTTDIDLTPSAALVTGRVVLADGGDAVLGAQAQTSGYTATTDGTGAFVVPMSPGTNVLTIRKTGYGDLVSAPITAALGMTVDAGTFGLVQGAVVTGVVVDAATGGAVASATVTTAGTAGAGYSLGDGRFTLYSGSGLRTFTASKAGYIPTTTPSYDLVPGGSLDLGQIPIAPAVSVTGTVVDASTLSPIAGASVTCFGTTNSVATNASGQFAISGIPGLNALTFAKTGYASSTSLVFGLSAGSPAALGTTYLSPLATVTGTLKLAPGVTVRVKGTGISTTTSASGAFTLSSPAGALTIQAVEGAMVVYETSVNVAPGESRNLGTLTGTAYLFANGYTASRAFTIPVTLTAVSGAATYSGLSFVVVPAGTYTVTASSPGWLSQTFGPYTLAAGDGRSPGDFYGNLYFVRAGSLVGTVTDATTGTPLPGASVVAGSASSVTDASGNFLLSLAAGSYPLTVSKSGYAGMTTASQTVVVGDERSAGIIALTAQPALPGTVIGTVVNAAGGGPVPGASVSLSGVPGSVTTDVSGAFSIQGAPGSYSVVVIKAGWATFATAEMTVAPGATTNASTIAISNVSGTVTGTVIDAATLLGVPGATVSVSGTPISCTTDSSGNFSLSLAPGSYALTASKDGWYAPTTAAFSVAGSGSVSIGSLWMSRNATISGRVVNSYGGGGVFGVLVQAGSAMATTDATGAFRALVPSTNSFGFKMGPASLSLTRDNWPSFLTGAIYPVSAGGSTDAGVLTMTGTGRIGGQLYYANLVNDPVVSATVTVTGTSNSVVPSGTSTPTTFFLAQAPGDNYTLTVQAAGALDLVTAPFSVRSGQFYDAGKLRIVRPIPVSGTIYDSSDGTAIPGVTVTVNPQGLTTTTNGYGIYSLYVNPGQVTFVLSKTGYPTKSIPTYIDPRTLAYISEDFYLDPPNSATLSSLTFDVASLNGGGISNLTSRLTKAAPPVGASVSLSSSDGSLLFFQTPYGSVGSISAVISGGQTFGVIPAYTAAVTHDTTVTMTGSYGGVTKTATLTLLAPPASLAGVAPGWVIPGDTTPVLYGSGIQAGSTVTFTGPVYSLTDLQHTLCTVGSTCASSSLAATVDTGGAYAAFAIPPGTSPGIYHLKVRSAFNVDSSNNQWIAVDAAQRTLAVVPPNQHNLATRIFPGQTVTGTFSGTNPLNNITDYNYYFFPATAGSTVNVSLERVDDSLSWEDPSSIDPALEIIAPDGMIYSNLQAFDNVPGIDNNASLIGAELPLTGVYFIVAETSRGAGAYRLRFDVVSMQPPQAGQSTFAVSGNHATVKLNAIVSAQAFVLDPRGHPIGGAAVSFAASPSPDNTGTVSFVSGTSAATSLDGYAIAKAKLTSVGKVAFSPRLPAGILSRSSTSESALLASSNSGAEQTMPARYEAAARWPVRILQISGETATTNQPPLERLEMQSKPRRHESDDPTDGHHPHQSAVGGVATKATDSPRSALAVRRPLASGSCFAETFDEEAVDEPQVNGPFSVVLTDRTPSTGSSTPNGIVGPDGIHGHRIEKEIRLKIDVKDAAGETPAYPVLVSLSTGGPSPGKFIVDPDGARVECDVASFIWQAPDAQGLNANQEIGYRIGTFSRFLGVTPSSGSYKPVWGVAELLTLLVSTEDDTGSEIQSVNVYPVLAEPGKPSQLVCVEPETGANCPDTFTYWSDFLKYPDGNTKQGGSPRFSAAGKSIADAYFLWDRYGNVTYGYRSASALPPQPNIGILFKDQTAGGSAFSTNSLDFAGYTLGVKWNDDPAMPSGTFTVNLNVDYPNDPDWSGGTVSKPVNLQFQRSQFHALIAQPSYEARFGVDDGMPPYRIRPGSKTVGLPKTSRADVVRLTLLGITGSQVLRVGGQAEEPFEDPHAIWKKSGSAWVVDHYDSPRDPRLEAIDTPSFVLTLVDESNQRVTTGSFRVHNCPRFDHEGPPNQPLQPGRPCVDTPIDSRDGIVDKVTLGSRGYFGIELLQAPKKLGYYFVRVEPYPGDTPRYRVREESDFTFGREPEKEYTAAFALCLVDRVPDPNPLCGPPDCSKCQRSPCYVSTGTYRADAVDLQMPTAGFPLEVSRHYFSSNHEATLHGSGWVSSLESRLSFVTTYAGGSYASALDILLPDGVTYRFTFNNPSGPFFPPAGRKDILVKNADLSFDLTLARSRNVYHFEPAGHLAGMRDEFGNAITIAYDASWKVQRISDAAGSGRWIGVSYRADGNVDSLTDSASRSVHYTYDGSGMLVGLTDPAGRTTRYTYGTGSFGPVLTQISDNWNRVLTVITYDTADRTQSYSENLETYTYSYVDLTHTTKTDSQGNTTTFNVGNAGLVGGETPPAAPGSAPNATTYDADGNVTRAIDEAGVGTSYSYDAQGHVASVTRDDSDPAAVRYDYAYDGTFPDKVVSVTPRRPSTNTVDPSWQAWRYDYFPPGSAAPGALQHVYRVRDDSTTTEAVATFAYDSQGRITSQRSATGASTDFAYDGQGNLSTVTHPANNDSGTRPLTSYSLYDGVGRPLQILDPALKSTTYTYDALGRVLTVTLPPPASGFPGAFTTTYSYDNFDGASGLVFTHITDPNGRLTKLGYDEHGRLVKSIDAQGNVTAYGYVRDVLATITDANGNVTSYHYDPLKRLDKTTFPDGSRESYTYWPDGLLSSKTDRKGQTIAYTYDAFKRLIKKDTGSNGTITYTYQGQKLTQVVDTTVTPAETHTFAYDGSYRVVQNVQGPRGTLSYTYTPDDRVEATTVASGPTATHTYYPDGSLNTIAWSPVGGLFKYAYTPRGQYERITFPNGQARTYAYDGQGRLTQLANALGATNLATYGYTYDVDWASGQNTMLGQRVSMTATVPSQGFSGAQTKYSYDPLYQLVKAEYPSGAPFNAETHQWSYDAIGNRLTNQVNAAIQSYTYGKNGTNPLNGQQLQNDGTNAYTYDLNGNQTTRSGPGGNYVFSYDFDNRLRTITGPVSVAYTYDYQGRRISKSDGVTTTTYLYDGLNLVAETTNAATTSYLFGPGIDEPVAAYRAGAISYIDVDGLGSTVVENDAGGTAQHSSIFDVWGVTRTETGTRFSAFGYTSREFGEAGLWFYRARWYQAGVGRFLSEDPFRGAVDSSFYRYAGGAPSHWIDPLGAEFGDYWDIRASLAFYDDVAKTSTDPLAAAGASVAAELLRTFGMADSQRAGELLGAGHTLCGSVKLALSLLKGLMLAAPLPLRGAGNPLAGPRLFNETRAFPTVSKRFWKALDGATHLGIRWDLHHWRLAQRLGGGNEAWKLIAIPKGLNSYMNGKAGTLWAEQLVRNFIYGAPAVGAAGGGLLGYLNEACGCND
jgi:trimeric autotransporter adhesin